MSMETDVELVGKVLDLQGVQSFSCWAVIPPMSGPWMISESPLPIIAADGKRLGFALTRLTPKVLEVHMFLAGDTAERLDLEMGKRLYVKPGNRSALYRGEIFAGCQIRDLLVTVNPDGATGLIETGPYWED